MKIWGKQRQIKQNKGFYPKSVKICAKVLVLFCSESCETDKCHEHVVKEVTKKKHTSESYS